MRSAYYPYAGLEIDYLYIVMFALTATSIGLVVIRTVVSKMQG
jgi:capsular polysaccharide transport system permease protein